MLILQASEDNGYLLIWGETPTGPDGGEEALALALRPFADEALAGLSWRASAYLPTIAGRPCPSSPLLGDTPVGEATLAPWPVTTMPLDTLEGARLLAACRESETLAPDVQIGTSLAFWARVYRFAVALVIRQQVVPDIAFEEDTCQARWRPVCVGEDAARFAALAKAMPPACRALTRGAEPPTIPATRALERVLGRLCDALLRPPTAPKKALPRFDSVHDAWLFALQSPDALVSGEPDALAAFARSVRRWHRPLSLFLAAPLRLCLRLEEPADGAPDSAPWYVRFLLQSVADPSLLVDADAAWSGKGAAAKLLARPDLSAREFLLTALGEASRLCPEIGASLKAERPGGYALSLSGAHTFLAERAFALEQAGFSVVLPHWWSRKNRPALTLRATAKAPRMQGGNALSLTSLLSLDYEALLAGETITLDELDRLAKAKQPLVRLRGQWVQVDRDEIVRALAYLKKRTAAAQTSLGDLVQMALGASETPGGIAVEAVAAEGEVGDLLARLTGERALEPIPVPEGFVGTLRPYQERGYAWLRFLTDLGLGACLADDMGLGKSAQTIALLLASRRPCLIVCPTSVLGNWQRELARFAPSLTVLAHHGPDRPKGKALASAASEHDVVLTSYALLTRDGEALQKIPFAGVALDEAQNVKNPETRQSRAARALRADWRVALTGTPVENHVGDLWALFAFLNPGLLGTESGFKREFFAPIQTERDEVAAARLKQRTGPLILRRMKTDKSVIADLPDKIEQEELCPLTAEQATLYEAVLRDMNERLEDESGMARRGLILATLTRLKQVCNHPAQFLGDGSGLEGRSGKLARLVELGDEIATAGDRALIFTQFAEMGTLLQRHLRQSLGRDVLFLHGGVAKKERDLLVERFQNERRAPFFVLSLKAGGVGLNLTAASHVIHFDRWWNPAVEDQATDRAFRIGQVKNVLVRKFVCQGTLEERIAEAIARKREVAGSVLGAGENWLTELSTGEIRSLFALSRERAVEEE